MEVLLALIIAPLIVLGIPFLLVCIGGFFIVQPRTQVVVLRWGKYKRTITEEGIAYVFPIGRRLQVATSSVISLDLPKMMVLEASGSPIEVSAVFQSSSLSLSCARSSIPRALTA